MKYDVCLDNEVYEFLRYFPELLDAYDNANDIPRSLFGYRKDAFPKYNWQMYRLLETQAHRKACVIDSIMKIYTLDYLRGAVQGRLLRNLLIAEIGR